MMIARVNFSLLAHLFSVKKWNKDNITMRVEPKIKMNIIKKLNQLGYKSIA